ncbi:transmembrane 9 superfamily member 11-like protein [Tanacetum coccineum]
MLYRNASLKVLGHILKEVMSESSRIYMGKEIMTDMNARFKIDISYSQARRAKCYALQLLRGTHEESFAELPLYFHNLKLKNQGTITHIETNDEDRFEIFFLVVGSMIRTFVLHMRLLIIIDGAHLKGKFLGTMYLAVAMDGNNQILPLAYGVGKSETFRSWDWFLTKLKECIIGKQDHLTIISDGAVSIASAIKNVFPNAFHGRCCRHLLMNLREKCPRFISKEELFWKACKAYRISDFEERFSTLRDWLPSIANKLDMIGLEKWARVHFPGMRYNYMTSNSAESVNALSRHSRKLPICMMIDWFIKSLQQWYFEHRQTADEHKHELTPWAEAKLAQRIAKSATWTVRPAANYLYNVVDYYKNATVDLNTRTCSCGQWQLSGLPCGHLIAVMRHLRQSSANQFAFSCFKTSVWRASYNEVIYDVGHPSEWDKPDGLIIVLPPVMDKRLPGRPRNRDRFRSKGEQITQKSCTRCFKGGHNRRDCPIIPSRASILQLAQLRKISEIREGGHNDEMSTQEYVKRITEEASEDDHFTRGPWLSMVPYLVVEGSIATGCFGDMKTFIKNGKVEKVVAAIKSCTPNMLGDLTLTLKDISGMIFGTIHHKVLKEEVYGMAIDVFHKDTSAVNSGSSTSRASYWAEEI